MLRRNNSPQVLPATVQIAPYQSLKDIRDDAGRVPHAALYPSDQWLDAKRRQNSTCALTPP
jgi:hypothetical protein